MEDKTIATRNDAEFDTLVGRFIERGEDQVTPQTLLEVMTDVAERRSPHEVELSGRVVKLRPRFPHWSARYFWPVMPRTVDSGAFLGFIIFVANRLG